VTDEAELKIGEPVALRSCLAGEPGVLLRFERGKAIVEWRDLEFIGRHSPASLVAVPNSASESPLSRSDCERRASLSNHSTYALNGFSERESKMAA